MTNDEILSYLDAVANRSERDDRRHPEPHRHRQFIRGWNDATLRGLKYADNTLTAITWRNLGFSFGQHFEGRSADEIEEAWTALATEYEAHGPRLISN